MRLVHVRRAFVALAVMLLPATGVAFSGNPGAVPEASVRAIRLAGPISETRAELSGLAWLDDELVLLPQFPGRFGGALFALAGHDVRAAVHGRRTDPLEPHTIAINAAEVEARVAGFEGFEAIAFRDDDVYLTIESKRAGLTVGWIVHGTVATDRRSIELDSESLRKLAPEAALDNMGFEALVMSGQDVVALYEVNAVSNRAPHGIVFGRDLAPLPAVPFARLEYRVTDATALDRLGHFWVTNVYWPGETWRPADCPLFRRFGKGPTHAAGRGVERLVELGLDRGRIRPTGRAPIQLSLRPEGTRNWEGIARLDDDGLLVATDEHPSTQLAFVAFGP